MSTKLKALGLALFAMAAMGAFGVMNAGATGGGDFDVGTGGTTITGFEDAGHNLVFFPAGGEPLDCTETSYSGETDDGTVDSITVTPAFAKCFTTSNPGTEFEVHENGCTFEFTAVPGNPETEHNTVHVCAQGGPIEITHPNCLITVANQTVGDRTAWDNHNLEPEGVTYDRITENGKHAITLTSTAVVETQYHGGICVFLGTKHTAEMAGSATVIAENNAEERVDLTATGE